MNGPGGTNPAALSYGMGTGGGGYTYWPGGAPSPWGGGGWGRKSRESAN